MARRTISRASCAVNRVAGNSRRRTGRMESDTRRSGQQFLEARSWPNDSLVSLGSGGNTANLHAGFLFEVRKVILRTRRQRGIARDAEGGAFPSGQLLVDRLDLFNLRHGGRHITERLAADAIAGADP